MFEDWVNGLADSIRNGDPSVQRRRAQREVDVIVIDILSDSYAAVYGASDVAVPPPELRVADFGTCGNCPDGPCSEFCCEQCDCSGDSSCVPDQWTCDYCGDSRFGRTDGRGCDSCNEVAERDDEDEAATTHPPLDSAITPDNPDRTDEEYFHSGVRELHLDLSFGAALDIIAYPDGSVTMKATPGSISGRECSSVSISAKHAKRIRKFLKESR